MITRLFLNNEEVELDNQVDFTINKAFEDITDPTTIINEWSKTVNIPFTNRNNQLFGSIFSIDRQILTGGSHPTGIYFDPTKKADFKLLYNNSLIMSGYCKLTTVTIKNSGSYYNINLFGQLGNIFHELQQLSFNPDLTDPSNIKYTIGKKVGDTYQPYVDEIINKDLINTAWTTEPTNFGLEGCKWNDIIGFACCNQGFNTDFESSSIQTKKDEDKTATDVLADHYSSERIDSKVAVENIIGDGLLPRQYGEYRSYYQTPYIYVNKMFQMLQAKCKELTDYEVVLDPTWFNPQNPYYSKLVMMLNNIATYDVNFTTDTFLFDLFNDGIGRTQISSNDALMNVSNAPIAFRGVDTDRLIDKNNISISGNDMSLINFTYCFGLLVDPNIFISSSQTVRIHQDNGIVITVKAISGTEVDRKTILLYGTNSNISDEIKETYDYAIQVTLNHTASETWEAKLAIKDVVFSIPKYVGSESVNFTIDYSWLNSNTTSYECQYSMGNWTDYHFYSDIRGYDGSTQPFQSSNAVSMESYAQWNRSNCRCDLRYLWDENTSFFDCILNYCKTYGIIFKVDEVNKQLKLLHRTTYFKDFTIEDWSDKLDRTQEFIISPITFDTKYVSFNYEDNTTDYNEIYSKRYDVNYGGLKLKTLYEFNNENTDLFKDLKTSIVNTATVLSWNNMLDNDITYYQTSEVMPYFNNKGDYTDPFGSFYFYNGLTEFDPELGTVRITDDSSHQITLKTFMYLKEGIGSESIVTTYPLLDIVSGNNLCLFNTPSSTYDIMKDYDGKDSIYTNFWKDWMDEQYNVQNKKISCYLNIHPIDYLKFDFNHFIMIENQLYLLNKIEDYDITNPETTKCELIGIQDTNAYTTIPFGGDYLAASDYTVVLGGGDSKKIKIYSNNGFVIDSYNHNVLDIVPSASTAKETEVIIRSKLFPSADMHMNLLVKSGDLTQNILITIKKSVINGNR